MFRDKINIIYISSLPYNIFSTISHHTRSRKIVKSLSDSKFVGDLYFIGINKYFSLVSLVKNILKRSKFNKGDIYKVNIMSKVPLRSIFRKKSDIDIRLQLLNELNKIKNKNFIILFHDPLLIQYLPKKIQIPIIFDSIEPLIIDERYIVKYKDNFLKDLYNNIANKCDLIFTNTIACKNFFDKINSSVNTYCIPNGIDNKHEIPNEDFEYNQLFDKIPTPIFGFIGDMGWNFDLNLFIEIVKGNSDLSFLHIGSTDQNNNIEKFEKLKSLNNFYQLGNIPSDTLPYYYSKIDFCLTIYKNLPFVEFLDSLKINEYLMYKKPIIGTPYPKHKIKNIKKGFFEINNVEEFRKVVKSILSLDSIPNSKINDTRKCNSWQDVTDEILAVTKNTVIA